MGTLELLIQGGKFPTSILSFSDFLGKGKILFVLEPFSILRFPNEEVFSFLNAQFAFVCLTETLKTGRAGFAEKLISNQTWFKYLETPTRKPKTARILHTKLHLVKSKYVLGIYHPF